MFFGNRLVKSIVLILGIFVLIINIVIWANDTDVVPKNFWDDIDQFGNLNWWTYENYNKSASPNGYYGFKWFFDKLSTFPGLKASWDMLQNFGNVITNFDVTGAVFLDVLIAIFRILFTPVMLLMTIVIDVYSNVKWFIEFIVFPGSPVKFE